MSRVRVQVACLKGRRIKLDHDLGNGPLTIGRAEDVTLTVTEDVKVSRRHCQIHMDGNGVILQDLGSSNGTWVNGSRIESVSVNGQLDFRVGQTPVRLTPEGASQAATVQPAVSVDEASDEDGLEELEVPLLVSSDEPNPDTVSSFRHGRYGIGTLEDLAHFGGGKRGELGPNDLNLMNSRGSMVHASNRSGDEHGGTAGALEKLRLILIGSLRSAASDIHMEPQREGAQVRLRIDGAMVPVCAINAEDAKRVVSIVKVLCDIDITQKAIIQEGHFSSSVPGRRVDYRVSFTPSMNGQKLVIRVLDPLAAPQTTRDLGLPEWMQKNVEQLVGSDTGMLLVCGPTGSGKTTTLYATLRTIDARSRNIITIEDPVEYEVPGVTQMPVNVDQGASFLSLLRSCLRQDPDVVILGEIRDKDTAVTAMQAATTGHLVLSTIHAKDTLGIIFRLLELGVEPYLVASTLNLLIAQRLVRRLCPMCAKRRKPTAHEMMRLDAQRYGLEAICEPKGCSACFDTGYAGRDGLFEMLVCNDQVRDVILNGANVADIKKSLGEGQFTSLLDAARAKVIEGHTSMEEVQRTVGFGDL